MKKKIILGAIGVFVLWLLLDYVIHGIILKPIYADSAALWHPMVDLKTGYIYISIFFSALAFSAIYGYLVTKKSPMTGLSYGFLYGAAVGLGMGYLRYSIMPIPYYMAITWFLGTVVEGSLGGFLLGEIMQTKKKRSSAKKKAVPKRSRRA